MKRLEVTFLGKPGVGTHTGRERGGAVPAHRVLPDGDSLLKMVAKGMTQQEIADETFRDTGVRVTRAAVSAALARAGAPPMRNRYSELLPWRVRAEDDNHYALRMLRAEARLRAGSQVSDRELRRLEAWKKTLKENQAVVHYDPDVKHSPRFFYVPARPGVDTDLIRVPDDQVSVA